MKKITRLLMLSVIVTTVISLAACDKNEDGVSTTDLRINLTDGPIDELDSVYIDVQEVRVKMGNDTLGDDDNGWVNLATTAGIYDLLSYQDGVDTLIGLGTVPTGYVKEIRLILGNNNSVVDSFGVVHPLTIPSGSESGLKIKVNKRLNASLTLY